MDTKEHEIIIRCISEADTRKAVDMVLFMKRNIEEALNALSKLVRSEDFDLDVNYKLILGLKEKILCSPRALIHSYEESYIIDTFEPAVWKFHRILSWPIQNINNSIKLEWAIGKLDYFKAQVENTSELDTDKLKACMKICYNLICHGSNCIRSRIYFAADNLASKMTRAGLMKESIPF